MSLVLTPEQQAVAEKFNEFLNSPHHIFMIKGSAGTGKTTLLKHLVGVVAERKIASFLMAPTGRAAKILSDKAGATATTIHLQIYALRKDKEYVDDDIVFGVRDNEAPENSIYFVDESSMVSDVEDLEEELKFGSGRLLNDLINYANLKNSHRKIVFIGDYAQLPPVGQNFSPALSEEYFREEYGLSAQSVMLTTVIRQAAESGIYKNSNNIRKGIEAQQYNQFSIEGTDDVGTFSADEFIERYNLLKERDGEDEVMVIAPSNVQALAYNEIIRNNKYGVSNLPLQKGDVLLVTRNNYTQGNVLFNGSFIRVYSVSDEVETLYAFVGNDRIALRFRSVEVLINGRPFRYYILDDFLTEREGQLPQIMRKALWANFDQRMREEKIAPKTKEFEIRKKSDPYFNALHCKYGYAITCHKSQGGEWKNVFVDMDVWMGRMCESFFRWAYTAITRAKQRLLHTSSPEFNAINQFVMHPIMQSKAGGVIFNVPQGEDYKEYFSSKMQSVASKYDISCSHSCHISWQHRFSFSTENESCILIVWYNAKFYTGKIDVYKTSSQEFTQQCKGVVKEAMHTIEFTFVPKFDFQAQMHAHIVDVVNECGLSLMNVVQNQWDDIYYIATDADTASIKFYYNTKGVYTHAIPSSTLGIEDCKLQKLIDSL